MIGSGILVLLLSAAATADPVTAAGTDSPAGAALPDESVVFDLRRARIAGESGDRERQRSILDGLVTAHPTDPATLTAALAYYRSVDAGGDAARAMRVRLTGALAEQGSWVPLPVIQEIAEDKQTTADELNRLISVLDAQPGEGSERLARARMRVDLLDRVGRHADALTALDSLATSDPDPMLTRRLVSAYRDAARWDDVLRVTSRLTDETWGFEWHWWRLDALGALSRLDDLAADAQSVVAQWRDKPEKRALLSPYVAERFFPYVFLLVDGGRQAAAQALVKELETWKLEGGSAERLDVMLFGSADDRSAFLASLAGATLASADPEKIRGEAYQRLLAKDFATASDLYGRLKQLGPSAMDGEDWFNAGLAAIETKAWPEAETAMTHAVETGVSKPRALAHRARARIMLGRIDDGLHDAEAALAIDPNLKIGCYAMYLGYQKAGNTAKAETWLARWKAL
jgi:hypothetical protein